MKSASAIAIAFAAAVLQRQVLHREVDALELAARHRQIARLAGAAGQQRPRRSRDAAASTGTSTPTLTPVRNTTPSASMQREPAVEDALLHLELGNAVAQQAADAIGLLEHGHGVAGAVQLIGRGEAGRAGTDDRDLLPRARRPAAAARPSLRRTRDR